MKKLILTITLALTASALLGQGTINFNNATSTYGTATPDHLIRIFEPVQLPPPWGPPYPLLTSNYSTVDLTGMRALLYYGASTQNSIAGLTAATGAPATFRASASAQAGAWIAPNAGALTLVGFDVGATINAAVLVWDSNKYATGLSAYNAFASGNWNGLFGTSGIFRYTVPALGSPPMAYFMANQQPFFVYASPEPSTFALVGLGTAVIVIFRRRK